MSKRKRDNGSRTIERRLAEGRGQGRGAAYKPWIEIHDLASHGQANRVKSPLHGRTCHLHSKLETDWFYAVHALRGLKDVREQFPLLELEETVGIADQLSIHHPTDPKSQEPCVVTTDFLLTLQDGGREVEMAIAIKPSADLASARTLEKLEIERVYWSARKVDWRILTERELPQALVKNLRWVQPHIDLISSGAFTVEEVARVRTAIEPEVLGGKESLVDITVRCDDRLGLKAGDALCVARHLIGIGAWPIDLTVEINPRKPVQIITNRSADEIALKLAA